MVLRGANYPRIPHEDYRAPAEPVLALVPHLLDIRIAWVPSDLGGDCVLAATLRAHGIETVSTDADFLPVRDPPAGADAIVDDPPFGGGGRLAVAFIEHAIRMVPFTALLLPADFESARGRAGLLLQRIVWFANAPASSAKHMWAIWDAGRGHRSPPIVHYEAEDPICRRVGAGIPLWWPPTRPAAASQRSYRVKD